MSASVKPGHNGLPTVFVENESATAEITLLGAHVISFIPKGGKDLMWMSPKTVYAEGSALRGGVPICWPWFGKKNGISHGIVRRYNWTFAGAEEISAAKTVVTFTIDDSEESMKVWDCKFHLEMKVTVADTLTLELTTVNTDSKAFEIGQAFHTYFNVGAISAVKVNGFENKEYLDKAAGSTGSGKVPNGPVVVEGEVDRVFQNAPGPFQIADASMNRAIEITTANSNSAVIWNPWIEKSTTMSDYPADGYLTMICVETCNAVDDVRTIQPGASHTLKATYSVKAL